LEAYRAANQVEALLRNDSHPMLVDAGVYLRCAQDFIEAFLKEVRPSAY